MESRVDEFLPLSGSRKEILHLLKLHQPLSVAQLAAALGISPMGTRQHLAILEREGLVQAAPRRLGPGRPGHVYTLTPRGDELFPRRYLDLALQLLSLVEAHGGPEELEGLLRLQAEQAVTELAPQMAGRALPEKVAVLAAFLERHGFMPGPADTQETSGAEKPLSLHLHNCPIRPVAQRYPMLCRLEAEALSRLLGARVRRTSCIAGGAFHCRYEIVDPGPH